MSDTTISLPDDLADELYDRKDRGESYADVIRRLIERADAPAAESDRERAETPPTDTADRPDTPTGTPDEDPHTLAETVGRETLPGSGAKLDKRVAALRAVVEYLEEHGTATPADFKTEVYPDHPARYTEAEDPRRSWWKNAMYPGLRDVAEHTEALEKADESGEWSYRGGDE